MSQLPNSSDLERSAKSRNEWRYEFVEFGDKGLQVSSEPGLLGPTELSQAVNILNDWDTLRSEFGYLNIVLADYVPAGFGPVRLIYTFRGKLVTEILVFTDLFVYIYDAAFQILVPIQGTLDAGLATAGTLPGATTLTTDVPLEDGDRVVVTLASGFRQTNRVLSHVGQVYQTLNPFREVVPVGAVVYRPRRFNGTAEKQIVADTDAASDRVFFTNGIDPPHFYDGAKVKPVEGLVDAADNPVVVSCVTIVCHYAHVLIGGLTENSVSHPNRVRWCEIGATNIWDWNENFLDVVETSDHIVTMVPLNKYIIIYKGASIFRMEYVGSTDLTWDFIKTIEDEGIFSPQSVCRVVNVHFVVGKRNFYIYDGEFSLRPVGDDVMDRFLGPRSVVERSHSGRIFCFFLRSRAEVWIFMPVKQEELIDSPWDDGTYWDDETGWDQLDGAVFSEVFRYRLSTGTWTRRRYPFEVTAAGSTVRNASMTWANARISWSAAKFSWISTLLTGEEESAIFGNATDNKLFAFTFASGTDDGDAIPWELETRDFYSANNLLRFDRFDLMLGGEQCKLSYSKDRGETWTRIAVLEATDVLRKISTYKQFTAQTVRFRLEGSGYMQFRFLGFTWKIETTEGL